MEQRSPYSPDGRYLWDGNAWVAVAHPRRRSRSLGIAAGLVGALIVLGVGGAFLLSHHVQDATGVTSAGPTPAAATPTSLPIRDPDVVNTETFGTVYMPQLQHFIDTGTAWAKGASRPSAAQLTATTAYADQVDGMVSTLAPLRLPNPLAADRDQLDGILSTFSSNLRTMVHNHQTLADSYVNQVMTGAVNNVGAAFQVFGDALAFQAGLMGATLPPFPSSAA